MSSGNRAATDAKASSIEHPSTSKVKKVSSGAEMPSIRSGPINVKAASVDQPSPIKDNNMTSSSTKTKRTRKVTEKSKKPKSSRNVKAPLSKKERYERMKTDATSGIESLCLIATMEQLGEGLVLMVADDSIKSLSAVIMSLLSIAMIVSLNFIFMKADYAISSEDDDADNLITWFSVFYNITFISIILNRLVVLALMCRDMTSVNLILKKVFPDKMRSKRNALQPEDIKSIDFSSMIIVSIDGVLLVLLVAILVKLAVVYTKRPTSTNTENSSTKTLENEINTDLKLVHYRSKNRCLVGSLIICIIICFTLMVVIGAVFHARKPEVRYGNCTHLAGDAAGLGTGDGLGV